MADLIDRDALCMEGRKPMRDKLIELIKSRRDPCDIGACPFTVDDVRPCSLCETESLAEHLIANGVTFATDNNVTCKWIPVSEAKPELIPNTTGTAYSDAVNCLTSGRKVITAIWDGTDFIGDAEFWEAEDETITHWCSVLLPLPAEVEK